MQDVYVKELWRYPVKSLRGEPLETADVALDGIHGDRCVHVQDDGRLITARSHPGRRLRTNIVLGGVHGLEERSWEGRLLRIGELVVFLDSLRGRCIVTTYDPDTLAQLPW